jgi:sugar lactone lactonase YvrE
VDAAAPLLTSPVPNGPKLVKIDLATDKVVQNIHFGPDIALTDSYLNDVRLDNAHNTAYLTDSGHGGLVVVDLASETARRVLDNDPSTHAQQGLPIVVNGKPVVGPDGKPPQFNADSIALSSDGSYLYYKPLTAVTLYRIRTSILRDVTATPSQLRAAVETVATLFPTDGIWMDRQDRLYLSDIEHNAVRVLLPNGKVQFVAADPRLLWPDTFTEGPDGAIYISASHINTSPPYNKGYRVDQIPFGVFRIDR